MLKTEAWYSQSSGEAHRYKLGPGTLYDNLEKLLNQGVVEESTRRSLADDPRRRHYRLTRFGRRLLATRSRGSKAWFARRGCTCEFGLRRHHDQASVSLSALVASRGVSAAIRGRNAVDLRRSRGCMGRAVILFRRHLLSRPAVATALGTLDMGGRGYRWNHPAHYCIRKFFALGQARGSLSLRAN